jgi:hypothetical protein
VGQDTGVVIQIVRVLPVDAGLDLLLVTVQEEATLREIAVVLIL